MIIITDDDGFVWLNVTDRARNIWNSGLFELYDVDFSGNSEGLIDNSEDLNSAIERSCVCIEVGHLPERYRTLQNLISSKTKTTINE